MSGAASRTMQLAQLRGCGIGAAAKDRPLFVGLFKLLWGLPTLKYPAQAKVCEDVARGRIDDACARLVHRTSFRRKSAWSLFWSLTEASAAIASRGRVASHEPELNGAFMALIAEAIRSFPMAQGSNVALVIGDHATLGNEARTGADFGLILEVQERSRIRYLVVLLQAKRATSRRVDVRRAAGDSTQLDRLVTSGIGSFLFYHVHDNPERLGPSVRDADSTRDNPASVDTLSPADDFATRMAVAADNLMASERPYGLPGMGAAGSREEALRMLFDPNLPGLKVNDVVVARVGDIGLDPRAVVDFEEEWRNLVKDHRDAVDRARGIIRDTDEEHEPPIILG